MPSYIETTHLRNMLGNIGATNVPDTVLTDAQTFADGTINSKLGVAVPSGNISFGRCVGIAYMFGKVFSQYGNETEAVRSLDFKIAMDLLNGLKEDMIANGTLDELQGTSSMIDDGGVMGEAYATRPLNPNGIVVLGAKNTGGVTTGKPTGSQIVSSQPPE